MKLDDKYQALKVLMHLPEDYQWLECYDDTVIGLSQFAKILLEYPEVMEEIVNLLYDDLWVDKATFTQSNILDEILKMEGKWK